MNVPQRTPEWYQSRSGRVTGSIAGALLDLSPYMTRAQAIAVITGDRKFEGNAATAWGTVNEPNAIADYEMDTGNKVQEVGFVPYLDWLGASPDGLIGSDRVLEVKCPFSLRDADNPTFKSLVEMPHYYAQVQLEMFVTGRKFCDFFQWAPRGYRLETVEFDEHWIEVTLPRLFAAWQEAQRLMEQDVGLIREYVELCDNIEKLEAIRDNIKEQIVETYGESDIGGVQIRRVRKAGAISYSKAVKDLLPNADLEAYRGKDSEFWTIKVVA